MRAFMLVAVSSARIGKSTTSNMHNTCSRNSLFMSQCASFSNISNKNPLFEYTKLPDFQNVSDKHVEPAMLQLISKFENDFKELEKKWESEPNQTFNSVIEASEVIEAPISFAWRLVGHLTSVKNSDGLRDAHKNMQPLVVQAFQKVGQSKPLFNALKSIDQSRLTESQKRIVVSSIKSMERSGIGLEDSKQGLFNKLRLESADLSTKFSNNLLDDQKRFKLELFSKNDVEGLPPSALELFSKYAVDSGHQDSTPSEGPWVVTLDQPSFIAFMQNARSSSLREKVYRAFISRAASEEYNNAPIIKRLLEIRKEISSMLGFSCYADLSLDTKMASEQKKVIDLLEFLREKTFDSAEKELKAMEKFANVTKLNPWDTSYWAERLKENNFHFQQEQLRPYFPLENVLNGMFLLAERLFGVRVVEADDEVSKWHTDVRYFKVVDTTSESMIASFFLDPYSRPAEKRGGAWMAPCQGRSKVLNQLPVAYLVCNGSPPVDKKPSLMTFQEVETLFHEFGHGLQHMLTEVADSEAAGINGIEWDAVELPSQFMENWCYDRNTLMNFARHYETGEPLPDDLFTKLTNAKNFNAGLAMLRQLQFGALDLTLHGESYDPYGNISAFEVQQKLAKRFSVIPPLPEDKFLCSFSHIFAGGYSAGYYSYKWAEVMSADAFAQFEESGLDNESAVRENGRLFRKTVLALGGSVHPSDVYRKFRGRDPSPDALLRHSGLVPAQARL